MSEHEAVYRILSLPLSDFNTSVVYVPCDRKEDRVRMVKPRKYIEKLEDDDSDIYAMNILEKYAARPNNLDSTCLASFATNYITTQYKGSKCGDVESDSDSDEKSVLIKMQDNKGFMKKRKKLAFSDTILYQKRLTERSTFIDFSYCIYHGDRKVNYLAKKIVMKSNL